MKHAARILVVDNNRGLRRTTRRTLEAAGYEILEASDGIEALQITRTHLPELALLDANLPTMDGFETCRQIKADPDLAGVYVILLSRKAGNEGRQAHELDAGADDYIVCPIPNRELLARVQVTLRLRAAEQALILSEQRFHTVYERLPLGYQSLDAEGRFLDVNQAWLSTLGYTRDEVIGRWFGDFLAPEQRELFKERFFRFKQAGETHNVEFEMLHKDGRCIFVSFDGRINYDEDMQFKQTHCILTDITARRRAEEALRENEAFIQLVLDNLPIGIAVNSVDPAVTFSYMNDNFPKFYRTTRENLADPDAFWNAVYEEPGFREEIKRRVLEDVASGDAKRMIWADVPLIRKGEGASFITARNIPIPDKPLMISTVWDVTERKRADEILKSYSEHLEIEVKQRTRELREAQEKLVRQERLAALGQLAGSVGHELRNPLGVIANAVYFLRIIQSDASSKVKEYLDIIEKEAFASNKIITDLLDFTRVSPLDQQLASVSELVHQTLERYPAPLSVQVTLEIPTGLPKIYADPQHVVQVLGNLVSNAFQAMEADGRLTVSAAAQDDRIRIAVQDTGRGIPPENLDKLFQPLFTTKAKGIGLGLAVSQKLAEANGGWIEVESEAGSGSTFTFCLPTCLALSSGEKT